MSTIEFATNYKQGNTVEMVRKTKLTAGSKTPATQRKETIAFRNNAKVANPNALTAKMERQARSAAIKAAALLAKAKREAAALNRKAAAAAKPGILQKKLTSFHTSHTKSLASLKQDAAAGTKPVWHHTVAAEGHATLAQTAAGHPDPNKSHPSIQLMHTSHAMDHLKQYAASRLGSPYGLGDGNLAVSTSRTHRWTSRRTFGLLLHFMLIIRTRGFVIRQWE